MNKYFGTDGIRGEANHDLTCDIARLSANALTCLKKNVKVVLGRDTRNSGEMFSHVMIGGLMEGGGEVVDLGIITTPAIAYLTQYFKADYGIVISASHNPAEFNGIKIFGADGYKICDNDKNFIESFIDEGKFNRVKASEIKPCVYETSAEKVYADYIVNCVGTSLKGLKVVLDCSNGAGYEVAPKVFERLGATVETIFSECCGKNINNNCGALYPHVCAEYVKEQNADFGLTLDGDADRLIAIDEKGNVVNGDSIVYILAKHYKDNGELVNDVAIGTSHTNMSVENKLKNFGISLHRSDIGDQNVLNLMIKEKAVLGGEQSGHIIISKYSTTGDGILAGVMLASLIAEKKKPLSELNDVAMYPQINLNVKVKNKRHVLESDAVKDAVKKAEAKIANCGRILVRASGTEPLVRIMVECESESLATDIAKQIEKIVKSVS